MSFGELLHKYVVRKEFDDEFKEVSNKYFRSVAHEFSNQKIIHNYSIGYYDIVSSPCTYYVQSLINEAKCNCYGKYFNQKNANEFFTMYKCAYGSIESSGNNNLIELYNSFLNTSDGDYGIQF